MKRKTMMVIAVISAVSLLAFLAFAGSTQESGYELFKTALKGQEHEAIESGELSGSFSITDNGETLIAVDGLVKGNENEAFSGKVTVQAEGFEKELEIYGLEGLFYLLDVEENNVYIGKDDDNFEEKQSHKRNFAKNKQDKEFDEKAEAILDILIGDLANEFEVIKDEDGTTDVMFELTKSEIPALLNMLTSMDHDDEASHEMHRDDQDMDLEVYPLFNELENLKIEGPELDDIELEYLSIVLDLDNNKQIEGLSVTVRVSGTDENDTDHEVEVKGSVTIESLGSVNVDSIQLEGLTVYELPEDK